jgi:hypothetical protein
LRHFAQTPHEILTLMMHYCDSLSALAASWHTELFLKSYSIPLMEPHMVCLEQGHLGQVAASPALIMLVPRRPWKGQ